jgi:hypothetical protein
VVAVSLAGLCSDLTQGMYTWCSGGEREGEGGRTAGQDQGVASVVSSRAARVARARASRDPKHLHATACPLMHLEPKSKPS